MKRPFIGILSVTAIISCTACGIEVVGSTDSPQLTMTSATTTGTHTTTAASTDAKASSDTAATAVSVQETAAATEPVTEARTASQEVIQAGGGEDSTQQYVPPSYSLAPSPDDYNYGPAPVCYDREGITYIQGVLIANKSYSLPADFYPGLDSVCEAQFYKLQSAAAQQGLNIWLASGFRSYDYQSQIYNSYVSLDGQAAADTYSARPGYSEHQSGLAIDVNQIDDSFIGTPEAVWLENHCHEYGFILRYPQGKQDITGYKYESWHIRYVGTDMSYPIHESGLTLEEYFGIDSYYH